MIRAAALLGSVKCESKFPFGKPASPQVPP